MKRVFVGPKQKTIKYTKFFDSSITLIGDNKNNNVAYHDDIPFEFWNDDNNLREIDIYNKVIETIKEPTEIMAYNPRLFSKCRLPSNVKQICKNSDKLLEILDNKIKTRKYFKGIVPMLEYYTIKGNDFNCDLLKSISSELIIQSPLGSGGAKTFYCNNNNFNQIKGMLKPNQEYSISAYQKDNLSYTIYGMLNDRQIEIMPPAQQQFELFYNIEWIGSEYDIEIQPIVKEKLIKYTTEICKKVQEDGYRGILNIDFIFANNELYLVETNPRFGGTIATVDALLQKSHLPSIFEYNYRAFNNQDLPSTKNMEKSIFK